MLRNIQQNDEELAELLEQEEKRQKCCLEMVASESIQSEELLSLAGSVFNNKTVVGLPGKQRLKGSIIADSLERLTAKRACEIFGADHANVNPYSGSVANYCAYAACMQPGDRAVALDASAGSHQTHGGRSNISANLYDFKYFGLKTDDYLIDYEEAERLISEYRPKLVVIGSSAYPRKIDYKRISEITHAVGAKLLVDLAHFSGLVAAGVSPNPVPYADIVTISGTKTMCGPHTGILLCTNEMAEAVDHQVYPGYVSSLHLQTIAALCYALKQTETKTFKDMMKQIIVNAQAFANALQKRGFGVLTGGTDCHIVWADLRPLHIEADTFVNDLEEIGIFANTKGIPGDISNVPNGVRAGTIVLTQRGMKETEMDQIADIWYRLAMDRSDNNKTSIKVEVEELANKFKI